VPLRIEDHGPPGDSHAAALATRRLALARAGWGLVLLGAPARLTGGRGEPPAARRRWVVRALGVRHLLQAAVTAWRPTPVVVAADAATDVLHAASMAALAVGDARWRGRAAADAVLATLFAATGARAAGATALTTCHPPHPSDRHRTGSGQGTRTAGTAGR
jgi:hypothetical protein